MLDAYVTDTFFKEVRDDVKTIMESIHQYDKLDFLYVEDTKETSDQKKGLIGKTFDVVVKIIRDALGIIRKAIDSITDKMRYGCLSKKKQEEFNEFRTWVENNPEIKNKKISVKDWQTITKEYDKIEKSIIEMMNDESVDANQLTTKSNEMFNDLDMLIGKGASVLTVDMALYIARKSPEMANHVMKVLSHNQTLLKKLEDELGEKEVNKMQNKVRNLTKETTGRKILSTLMMRKEKSVSECLTEISNEFKALKDAGTGKGSKVDMVKQVIKHRTAVAGVAKQYVKDKNVRKGVKNVGSAAKNIGNTVNTIKSVIKPNDG